MNSTTKTVLIVAAAFILGGAWANKTPLIKDIVRKIPGSI